MGLELHCTTFGYVLVVSLILAFVGYVLDISEITAFVNSVHFLYWILGLFAICKAPDLLNYLSDEAGKLADKY